MQNAPDLKDYLSYHFYKSIRLGFCNVRFLLFILCIYVDSYIPIFFQLTFDLCSVFNKASLTIGTKQMKELHVENVEMQIVTTSAKDVFHIFDELRFHKFVKDDSAEPCSAEFNVYEILHSHDDQTWESSSDFWSQDLTANFRLRANNIFQFTNSSCPASLCRAADCASNLNETDCLLSLTHNDTQLFPENVRRAEASIGSAGELLKVSC